MEKGECYGIKSCFHRELLFEFSDTNIQSAILFIL